jgi:hypothetical protein
MRGTAMMDCGGGVAGGNINVDVENEADFPRA